MKNFLRLMDYTKEELFDIFRITDEIKQGKYSELLKGKTVVMFFPSSSIRTRVTFEKAIWLLGGQSILFPSDALDKKEELQDAIGYLNNWADMVIVRHKDFSVIEKIAKNSTVPVINAMSSINHPCEILTDLYALSKCRNDFTKDKYLYCGVNGNIGKSWVEASKIFGFEIAQCCPKGFELPEIDCYHEIFDAVKGRDVVCTDSLPENAKDKFAECQVNMDAMKQANKGAILNPCPPFYRGEEISADVIASEFFVGYEFKKNLLEVQQAIMVWCMQN